MSKKTQYIAFTVGIEFQSNEGGIDIEKNQEEIRKQVIELIDPQKINTKGARANWVAVDIQGVVLNPKTYSH